MNPYPPTRFFPPAICGVPARPPPDFVCNLVNVRLRVHRRVMSKYKTDTAFGLAPHQRGGCGPPGLSRSLRRVRRGTDVEYHEALKKQPSTAREF